MRTQYFTAALILSSTLACADPTTAPATQPIEVVRFTIHPVATSQPALQYPLLPPMTERRPGNAAVQYMIAADRLPRRPPADDPNDKAWKFWDQLQEQLDASTDTFNLNVATEVMDQASGRFIDTAARRDHADWDVDFRGAGLYALLPQLNAMRVMTNIVTVRSRLDIARGDWVAADQSLQSGFAMSWHLNDQPAAVQALIASGITDFTLSKAVHDWISHGGPNLYWSLTNLPATVDLHSVSDTEQAMVPLTDPLFQSALAGTLPPEQWRATLERVLQRLARVFSQDGYLSASELSIRYDKLLKSTFPRAAARLSAKGMSAEQIAAVPQDRAVGEFIFDEYRELSDELWKGWQLPFAEAAPLLRSGRDAINLAKTRGNPLMTWVPDIFRTRVSLVALDQHLAALRIVEAVRDYAARHDGKLPRSLADITQLPIPLDPVNGQPFTYQLVGWTAVLTLATPDLPRKTVRYELIGQEQ